MIHMQPILHDFIGNAILIYYSGSNNKTLRGGSCRYMSYPSAFTFERTLHDINGINLIPELISRDIFEAISFSIFGQSRNDPFMSLIRIYSSLG